MPADAKAALAARLAMPPCGRIRADGAPCRQPVKVAGAPCRFHGGIRVAVTGRARAAMLARRRAWAHRWSVIKAAPADLQRTHEWQVAARARLSAARYRLVLAWQALQAGDPAPWRAERVRLAEIIDDARRRRDRGDSDAGICVRLGI